MSTEQKVKKSLVSKLLKWTGVLILIVILALFSVPFLFKDKIIQLVKDETNKNLNAKVNFGDFDLSVFSSFPDLRFNIENVTVANKGEFEGDTLVSLGELKVDLNLMSVINGEQYKIKSIELSKPKIYVHVLPNGSANYLITKADTDTSTTVEDTAQTKFKLNLKSFSISDGDIAYHDQQTAMKASIKGLDFTLGGDFSQDNFVMQVLTQIKKLSFEMQGIAYLKEVNTKLELEMDMNMPQMKFTFKKNQLDLNALSLGLTGFLAMPKDDIEMDLQLEAKKTEFKTILSLIPAVYSKEFASIKTKGKLELKGFAKGIYNDKSLPAFGVKLGISDAMFKYPDLPKSVDNISVLLEVNNPDGVPDHTVVDVKKFHIEMAGNPIDMNMHVETPVSDPNLNGSIKGKIILASVKDFVPLEKGDELNGKIEANVNLAGRVSAIEQEKYELFKAEGDVDIDNFTYKTSALPYDVFIGKMALKFSPQYVSLDEFNAKMGKSDISATGRIDNFLQYIFKDSLVKGSFNFNSGLLDLNELMLPSDSEAVGTVPDTSPLSVIEVPKNIDFTLNSSIGKILYDKLEISNVSGNVNIKNARLSMNELKMELLEGKLLASGFYDTKNPVKPEILFDLNMVDFDIQKTFNSFNTVQKLAPVGKYSKGKFTGTLNNLVGTLNKDMMPDLNSLSGEGVFKTSNVAIEGFEPLVKLAEALKQDKFKTVELQNISANYKFKNGRVETQPFVVNVKNVNTTISGSTGFDQTIDYKWDMEMQTKDLPGPASSFVQGLLSQANQKAGTSISLPDKAKITVLFGGTVTKPTVKTGLKDRMNEKKEEIKEQIKELIEEKKQEVITEVKDRAKEEAEKLIAEAQKKADLLKEEAAKLAETVRNEANSKATELENKSGNPLEKLANKKLAEKLRKEGESKSQKINQEAAEKADKIMEEARQKAALIK